MRTAWTWASVAVLGTLGMFAPLYLPAFYLRLLTESLIYAMFAMSIDLLAGYAGLVTLGHAGIFGISAYLVGYLTARLGLPMHVTFPCGVLGAVGASLLFGIMAVRTSGVYFLLITMAQGMIVWGLAFRWTSVTGSENGIRGILRPDALATQQAYYYVILGAFVLVAFLLVRLVRSPFGLSLLGLRENEARLRALGYSVWLHRLLAFLVSGCFAGIAGAFYAFHNNFVSPDAVHFVLSGQGLLMVILGGAGTLVGPVVGAGVFIFLRNVVSLYTDRWPMVLGALFVLTVLLAPQGLVGLARQLLRRWPAGAEPAPVGSTLPYGVVSPQPLDGRNNPAPHQPTNHPGKRRR
ncbi:MAG: branched-chain amino acid ABC transporter permease [Candidatus Tectimicrobiota bacterium]|nr:MAG: branched-chain amino acid ABC transporter permease [Candidatus Tectomicrobia bacterium]